MENTNTLASFTHIMGGYDAGYYGYMWSEVYAKLLHNEFKNNMLNPALGMKLRKYILAPGGTQDSNISMEQFLGRPLNFNEDVSVFTNSIFSDSHIDNQTIDIVTNTEQCLGKPLNFTEDVYVFTNDGFSDSHIDVTVMSMDNLKIDIVTDTEQN
jgi:hypothetical protein